MRSRRGLFEITRGSILQIWTFVNSKLVSARFPRHYSENLRGEKSKTAPFTKNERHPKSILSATRDPKSYRIAPHPLPPTPPGKPPRDSLQHVYRAFNSNNFLLIISSQFTPPT